MTPQQWDDERLLAELAEALRLAGDVPERLVRAGQLAYTWRTVDEELALASLCYDSERDAEPALRGAATASPRLVVFEADGLAVELQLDDGAVQGQLVPPHPGRVTLERQDGTRRSLVADEAGCFHVERPSGRWRLVCHTEAGGLVTEWVDL